MVSLPDCVTSLTLFRRARRLFFGNFADKCCPFRLEAMSAAH